MTDADILAVLRSIDKSLKSASSTTKERPSLTRQVAGGANNPDKRDAAEASKAIRATASSARKLSTATQGLTKSFDGLNVEVRRTISNFGSLGTQLSKLISSLDVRPNVQQPVLNLDSKELSSFKMELNKSIGTFGMLNTRIGKLVDRISNLTPDRDRLTKAIIDVTTKSMQPMQTLGKQLSQVTSQLNLFSSSLAKSIDGVDKALGQFTFDPTSVKNANDFGSKLGELANNTTIDTKWVTELEQLVGTRLSPRLVELSDAAQILQKEFVRLSDVDFKKNEVNARELNKAVKNAIMIARQFNASSSALALNFKNVGDSVKALGQKVNEAGTSVTKFIDSLNAQIQTSTASAPQQGLLAGIMGAIGGLFARQPQQPTQPTVVATVQTPTPGTTQGASTPPPNVPLAPLASAAGGARKGLLGVATGALRSGVGLMLFEKAVSTAWHAAVVLADNFFKLASVGMGSTDALLSIGKAALTSGMSIEEYTKVLADNAELASRAGSIDNFNKLTSAADKQLAQLGVFGADARALQASLANSATLSGIPQQQLAAAVSTQIDTFDRLRKSVNMTSAEFADLVANVTNNVQSQKELVGLAPAERATRQAELVQIAATGRSLGLSAEASKRLTDALIAQRGETVKKRFESAGRVRQLAAMTGDAGAGEEAAQIIMKGRRASADELERLRQIAGNLDQSAQGLYENGNFGQQAALDTLDEALNGSAFKNVMEANRPAQLADESAKLYNKDFGNHVGEFAQAVGQFRTILTGVSKSAFAPLIGVVAGLAGGAFAKILGGNILSAFKSGGGIGGAGAGGAQATAATGVASKLANAAKTTLGALNNLSNSVYGFLNKIISAPINAIKNIGGWIGKLYGVMSGFSGRMFTGLVNGIADVWLSVNQAGGVLPKTAQLFGSGVARFTEMFPNLSAAVARLASGISGSISSITKSVGSGELLSKIGNSLAKGLGALKSVISSASEGGNALSKLGSSLNTGWNTVKAFVSTAGETGGFLSRVGASLNAGWNTFKTFVAGAGEGGGLLQKAGSLLSSGWTRFTGFFGAANSAAATISNTGGALSNAWNTFTGFFRSIPGVASNIFKAVPTQLVSSFGAAFNSVGPLLKGVLKFAGWLGPLIDGVGEAFTGAITSTFSEGGGITDRIFGVVFAAFRGIPAGILGLVDNIFGTNFKNGLDIVLTTMVLGIQTIKNKFFDGLYAVVTSIPFLKNTAFAQTLKGWKDQQQQDVDKTASTLDALINDSSKNLDTIGKKNTEEAEARQKSTEQATVKVAETDKKFTDKFNSTAAGMVNRAGLISDAKALAGMPAQQNVSTVTPTANAAATVTPPAPQTQQANLNTADKTATQDKNNTANSTPDMTAQLMEMVKLLQASLAVQQRQVEIGEQQLGKLDTKPATSFIPADYVNYHLLNA